MMNKETLLSTDHTAWISRRGFIGGMAASVAVASKADSPATFDPNIIALIADTHIPGQVYKGWAKDFSFQPRRLKKVVADILAMRPLPAQVIHFGDVAYLFGKRVDYEAAATLLKPLQDVGIKVNLMMGNHDKKAALQEVFPEYSTRKEQSERIAYSVETPYADFLLLDSCNETVRENKDYDWGTGNIDPDQRTWMMDKLKAATKPTFVCAHHSPFELRLTDSLMKSLPAVAGFIHGHEHVWRKDWFHGAYNDVRTIRSLSLPSTGHTGDIGYAVMRLHPDRAVVEVYQDDFYFPFAVYDEKKRPADWSIHVAENKGQTCTFLYRP